MADYTNYNQGSSNKGAIAALIVLGALIIGIFWIAANAPAVEEGVPITTETAPAATESAAPAAGSE